MAKTYPREAVEQLLSSLEQQAREVVAISRQAQKGFSQSIYLDYRAFRERVSEFEVFAMIIDHRLANIVEGRDAALEMKLDELSGSILNHLIQSSISFFTILSEGDLPLGSRDVFVSELKSMYQAREKLSADRYKLFHTPEVQKTLRIAEKILHEIIDRAPGLLAFEE